MLEGGAVLEQLLVPPPHPLARLDEDVLDQLVRGHALQRHLAHHTEPAEADLCEVEELGALGLGEDHLAQPGGVQREADHL